MDFDKLPLLIRWFDAAEWVRGLPTPRLSRPWADAAAVAATLRLAAAEKETVRAVHTLTQPWQGFRKGAVVIVTARAVVLMERDYMQADDETKPRP